MVDLSALSNFKQGLPTIASYSWVLYVFLIPAILIFVAVLIKKRRDIKEQWTHTLVVKRRLNNGLLTKPVTHRMKRFPLVRNANVFQLENAFLGKYLIPELDSYTGHNEFTVVIDTNNRILVSKGETFNPDSGYIEVSCKHPGMDLAFDKLNSDWTEINKTAKKADWKDIAKFAMVGLLIIAVMVVAIKGIGQWGENHKIDSQKAQAEAEQARQMSEMMKTTEASLNAQVLVLELFKEIYQKENLRGIIDEKINKTVS